MVKGLGLGGMERILSESIPYLDRHRFDYEVCYFTSWKDDVAPNFEQAGISTFCLGIDKDTSPRNITRVRSFLAEREYDIIHTHSPFPSAVARIVAPRRGLKGIVHTEHSLPASRQLLTRLANRLTYPVCDVVISVSGVVEREVSRGRFLKPKSSRIIYGGVGEQALQDVPPGSVEHVRESLTIPDSHQIVGNVAHLRSQKGHDLWLETARLVLEQRPETTFVIVGREKQPGYQNALENRAGELGIADRVRFVGFQPDPYPFLASFDVFLMTSQFEGFPIALVEAMVMGIPVVSTDVGGVSEALGDDQTGLLAPSGDSAGLAGHVIELLGDEQRRKEFAERARVRARSEFTLERMVEHVEATYEELLGRSPA